MSHPTGPPHHWRDAALCRGEDPELFYPVGTTGPAAAQTISAKLICQRCPVADPCLATALAIGAHGIWGGTDELERAAITRKRRKEVSV